MGGSVQKLESTGLLHAGSDWHPCADCRRSNCERSSGPTRKLAPYSVLSTEYPVQTTATKYPRLASRRRFLFLYPHVNVIIHIRVRSASNLCTFCSFQADLRRSAWTQTQC